MHETIVGLGLRSPPPMWCIAIAVRLGILRSQTIGVCNGGQWFGLRRSVTPAGKKFVHLLLQHGERVVLPQKKHLVWREIRRGTDQTMTAAADRRAQMLDVLDLKRRAVHGEDSHRGVGRELGAILCQRKRYGQKLLHREDAAQHQGR